MLKYDTGLKEANEILENFVDKRLFEDIIKDLHPNKGELTTQHRIITGCRGSGKTHLVKALHHKLSADEILSKHYLAVHLPEELYIVDSLYRFLQEICNRLIEQTKGIEEYEGLQKEWSDLYKKIKSKGSDKKNRNQREIEMMDYLNRFHQVTGKKIVLLCENLQDILGEVLSDDEQKRLRAFLNESLHTLLIIGTAVSVFSKVQDHGKPFYHFFQFREIEELSKEDSYKFLLNYASYNKDEHVERLLKEVKHKIYAFQTLTGGNPRMLLVLYEYLKEANTYETGKLLEKLITDLTPYYKHETDKLSPQKRIVLTGLLLGPPAKTPSEISAEVEEPLRTVVTQLDRLKKENWIKAYPMKAGEGVKRSEEFYIIREYFYRIWYQLRTCGTCRSNIGWMAELASLLFSEEEIRGKLEDKSLEGLQVKEIYKGALSLLTDEQWSGSLKRIVQYSSGMEDKISKLGNAIKEAIKNKAFTDAERLANEALVIAESQKNIPFQKVLFRLLSFICIVKSEHVKAYQYMLKTESDEMSKDSDKIIWGQLGFFFFEHDDYDRAILCGEKIIQIAPDDAPSLANLGLLYSMKKDFKKALRYAKKAATIDPEDFVTWLNIGIVLSNKKDYKEAIKYFEKALTLKPDMANTWNALGCTYNEMKQFNEAIESFKKAIKLNTTNVVIWNNLGAAYSANGEIEKAIHCYKKSVEVEPTNHEGLFYLGATYTEKGDYKNAFDTLKKYILVVPKFEPKAHNAFRSIKSYYTAKEKHSESLRTALDENNSIVQRVDALLFLIMIGNVEILQEVLDSLQKHNLKLVDDAFKHLLFFANFGLIDALKDKENPKAIESLSGFYCTLLKSMPEKDVNQQIFEFLNCSAKLLEKESTPNLKKVFDGWRAAGLDIPEVAFPIIDAIKNPNSREARKWAADPMFREITEMLNKEKVGGRLKD